MVKLEITVDDETAATLRETAEILNVTVETAAEIVVMRYAERHRDIVAGALLGVADRVTGGNTQ